MHPLMRQTAGAGFAALLGISLTACQKRGKETAKADLLEAGYQFTQADWFRAVHQNDVLALKKFSSAKFPADTRQANGDSALHESATAGAEAAADYLLKCGLPIDSLGADDSTPLMSAIASDQTSMVRWLLRQGANPKLKNRQGFSPLMLAVQKGHPGSVTELAAHTREDLDPALLLAALVGKAAVIDSLTNFGASIHTRMQDGRTPLMIAAENGHNECVTLLLDIGSSRLATDSSGRTAADIATAAGFPEIAAQLNREPLPSELALESPAEIATAMEHLVDVASEPTAPPRPRASPARSLAGATLSKASTVPKSVISPGSAAAEFTSPPLIMRSYREREVPLQVKSVQGDTATLSLPGRSARQITVHAGDTIPGSMLTVVRVHRRMEISKVNPDGNSEISTVQVRDSRSGQTREWITGVPSTAHDPSALVEDAATGQRYIASPGQHFKGADGAEYFISDVRPNQLVIQEMASGAVQTIPLRGPRG